MIINIKNKTDLITLDLRIKQIRYVKNSESTISKDKEIFFIPLSNHDEIGYKYLLEHNKKEFLKFLFDDLRNEGFKVKLKDLEVLEK